MQAWPSRYHQFLPERRGLPCQALWSSNWIIPILPNTIGKVLARQAAIRRQVELARTGWRRPLVDASPDVGARFEQTHFRRLLPTVIDTLQEVVVKGCGGFSDVEIGLGPEVSTVDVEQPGADRMRPRTDDEPLLISRRGNA